jgi:hypothetical protein
VYALFSIDKIMGSPPNHQLLSSCERESCGGRFLETLVGKIEAMKIVNEWDTLIAYDGQKKWKTRFFRETYQLLPENISFFAGKSEKDKVKEMKDSHKSAFASYTRRFFKENGARRRLLEMYRTVRTLVF